MKKILKQIFKLFGYKISRIQKSKDFSENLDFKKYFEQTEGSISFEEAKLLYELAKSVKDGCIIEVGSYRGRSTVALGLGSMDGSQVPVFAIDPHEPYTGILGRKFGPQDRGAFFRAMLMSDCFNVVRLINLSSESIVYNWDKKVSLLWIDGDHTYKGVKRDYECWEKYLTLDSLVVFDDSLDRNIGPKRLIDELISQGKLAKVRQIGKITQLKVQSIQPVPTSEIISTSNL